MRGRPYPSTLERLYAQIVPDLNGGCWLWSGYMKNGYGAICHNGKQTYAHRVSWLLHRGPLNGLFALHKCDVRACVNPDHLFLGTQTDNMSDCAAKGRLHLMIGAANSNTKITAAQALEIYTLRGRVTQHELAARFGLYDATISAIHTGRSWRHVTGATKP